MPRGVNTQDEGRIQGRNVVNANSSNIVSPGIVTDGLVLYVDAGNRVSYPTSGTVFRDITDNLKNGTLEGSPTFNLENGGALQFDGLTQQVNFGTDKLPEGDISVCAWIYPTAFNGGQGFQIVSTKWLNPSLSDFHYGLRTDGSGNTKQNLFTTSNSNIYGTSNFFINNWYSICFTLVNGSLLTFYTNGSSDGTQSGVSRTSQSSTLFLGDGRSEGLTKYGLVGKIPQLAIYRRALTPTEVQQNFNATRSRFNI